MKIFYAVQATGNGHISRAMELLPYLELYGKVDVFLSGANSTLYPDLPVKYRSKGLSLFYTCNGGLHYSKIFRQLSLARIRKEVRDLPVETYDLVINDFDCITAIACRRKNISSVNLGHQASFMSQNTPRPDKKSIVGEWVLKNYAKATQYFGLHFQAYDDFIFSPVIKKDILTADPGDRGYFTVYLPSFCQKELLQHFSKLEDHKFEIFLWSVDKPELYGNVKFLPVSRRGFNNSLINCSGIICGGGFETPAEALYLQKKILAVPIAGQYEQQCNAAALQKLGVKVIDRLNQNFEADFNDWLTNYGNVHWKLEHSTSEIVERMFEICAQPTRKSAPLEYVL